MKKPIFTSLSPNTETDDVLLALKILFQPWKWTHGLASSELEKKFQEYLPTKHAFTFVSGRSALSALLSSLNLKPNDEILLSGFTCVAVPNAVIWAGGLPVYVDIEEESFNLSLLDLEKKINPKSKVLIIQHTFGQPADLDKILPLARKHKLFVIEDCAHALGARYFGQKVGTFGDAAFFSFGRDKVISSVFGGLLVTNSESVASGVLTTLKSLNPPTSFWTLQQLLHPIITSLVKLTYGFGLGKSLLALSQRLNIISRAVYPEEKRAQKPSFIGFKLPNALAILALHQFTKLEKINSHRQKIAKIYEQKLNTLPIQSPRIEDNLQHLFLRYPLLVKKPDELLINAKKENLLLDNWYNPALSPQGIDYSKVFYNPKDYPISQKVAQHILNLPTHINLTKQDAQRIVNFLRKQLSENPVILGNEVTPESRKLRILDKPE